MSDIAKIKALPAPCNELIRRVEIVVGYAGNIKEPSSLILAQRRPDLSVVFIAIIAKFLAHHPSVFADVPHVDSPSIYADRVYLPAFAAGKFYCRNYLGIEHIKIPIQLAFSLCRAVGKTVDRLLSQLAAVKLKDNAPAGTRAQIYCQHPCHLIHSHHPLKLSSISFTCSLLIGLIFAADFARSTERAE